MHLHYAFLVTNGMVTMLQVKTPCSLRSMLEEDLANRTVQEADDMRSLKISVAVLLIPLDTVHLILVGSLSQRGQVVVEDLVHERHICSVGIGMKSSLNTEHRSKS